MANQYFSSVMEYRVLFLYTLVGAVWILIEFLLASQFCVLGVMHAWLPITNYIHAFFLTFKADRIDLIRMLGFTPTCFADIYVRMHCAAVIPDSIALLENLRVLWLFKNKLKSELLSVLV